MKKIKIVILLIFLCAGAFMSLRTVLTQTNQTQTNQKKTAAEVYKNIQVLKDMPAEQLDKVMATFTGSLGVNCNFCHVPGQREKDDKPEKQTARKMLRMVFDINKENFDGRAQVSCMTCHQGKPQPLSIPLVGQNTLQSPIVQSGKEALPTVDQILEKYVQAGGGKTGTAKISTLTLKGSRIGADGVAIPEEVYYKAPDKMLVITTYPEVTFNTGYDGATVWARNSKGESKIGSDEQEQFKRETQLFQPAKIKDIYREMSVAGVEKINDNEAFVVLAVTPNGGRERLFFDQQSGLLVRRVTAFQTVIGIYPYQVDYSEYKTFDGIQIPTAIQWSIPGRTWRRKVAEVRQDVPLEDKRFNPSAQ